MTETPSRASTFKRVSTWWRALAVSLLVLLLGWAAGTSMVEPLKAQLGQQARLAQVVQMVQVAQVREIAVLLDQQQLPAMFVAHNPNRARCCSA